MNLKGRDLLLPHLGLRVLLWTVRGFVRAEDSNYLPWSPIVPQRFQVYCRRGLCRGHLKFLTNWA